MLETAYWGIHCIVCGEFHPMQLASSNDQETPPDVAQFTIYCGSKEILFARRDLVKYLGPPPDDSFRPHPLFQ